MSALKLELHDMSAGTQYTHGAILETHQQVESLPEHSIVRDDGGDVYARLGSLMGYGDWFACGSSAPRQSTDMAFPVELTFADYSE